MREVWGSSVSDDYVLPFCSTGRGKKEGEGEIR